MTKTNNFESTSDKKEIPPRIKLAAKVIGATAVATLAGVAYNNTRDYGYHPDRNPAPPTYMQQNEGIDPASIVRDSSQK